MTQTNLTTRRADQFQGDREAFPVASGDSMNSPNRPKRIVGASQRRAEIVIAALFVLTAATSIPGAFAIDPMLNASNYLAWIFPTRQQSNWMPCCGRSTTLGLSLSHAMRNEV